MKLFLPVIILLLSSKTTFAQSPLVTPLVTHLESIRQGSHAVVPQTILADTASATAILSTLATYQSDTLAADYPPTLMGGESYSPAWKSVAAGRTKITLK